MPGFDRSGPAGQGPMTGRGMGRCAGNDAQTRTPRGFFGRGRGYGRGFGRGFGANAVSGRRGFYANDTAEPVNRKELLEEQKAFLENELAAVNAELKEDNE